MADFQSHLAAKEIGCNMLCSLDSFEQLQSLKDWLEDHAVKNPVLNFKLQTSAKPSEEMKKDLLEMLSLMFNPKAKS